MSDKVDLARKNEQEGKKRLEEAEIYRAGAIALKRFDEARYNSLLEHAGQAFYAAGGRYLEAGMEFKAEANYRLVTRIATKLYGDVSKKPFWERLYHHKSQELQSSRLAKSAARRNVASTVASILGLGLGAFFFANNFLGNSNIQLSPGGGLNYFGWQFYCGVILVLAGLFGLYTWVKGSKKSKSATKVSSKKKRR